MVQAPLWLLAVDCAYSFWAGPTAMLSLSAIKLYPGRHRHAIHSRKPQLHGAQSCVCEMMDARWPQNGSSLRFQPVNNLCEDQRVVRQTGFVRSHVCLGM